MKQRASLKRGSQPSVAAPARRRRWALNRRLYIGLTLIAIFAIGSLLLPLFTKVDPAAQGTYLKNLRMTGKHLLGTNALGQDIFWYLVFAIRNSLLLGVGVSLGITAISTFLGLSAGYIGGRVPTRSTSSSARSFRMCTPTWWSASSTRFCSRSTPRRRWR